MAMKEKKNKDPSIVFKGALKKEEDPVKPFWENISLGKIKWNKKTVPKKYSFIVPWQLIKR